MHKIKECDTKDNVKKAIWSGVIFVALIPATTALNYTSNEAFNANSKKGVGYNKGELLW